MIHKVAVELYGADFTVDAMALNGGAVGVDINFKSNGSVVNSRFLGAKIAGVLVERTDSARIEDNEFVRNEVGVSAYANFSTAISGLTVEANSIEDGFIGVQFLGISESTVQDNVVRNHWRGILLEPNIKCQDPPGPECYYSSGNVITGNTVRGNQVDLYHHEKCVPNTWERNYCRTKEGAEIPRCSRRWRGPSRLLEPVSP
jgi:hypothetical protein